MIRAVLAAALALALTGCANAATLGFSIVINSPPSTSITCPVQYPTGATAFTAPVAAGTLICPITVVPSGWSGSLTLGGPNANLVSIASGPSGSELVVGSSPITTPGTYTMTITASP